MLRAIFDGVPAGEAMGNADVAREAERLRVEDLVRFGVVEDGFGMDSGFVGEGGDAGDVVVEGDVHAHHLRDGLVNFTQQREIVLFDQGRIYGIETHAETRRNIKFRELADELLPPRAFRKFNLALLDLGALVCVRNPKCNICPVKRICSYYDSVQKI